MDNISATPVHALFPHAHTEPHKGRWRVIVTTSDGRQEVFHSGLGRRAAERIAAGMRTVDRSY